MGCGESASEKLRTQVREGLDLSTVHIMMTYVHPTLLNDLERDLTPAYLLRLLLWVMSIP